MSTGLAWTEERGGRNTSDIIITLRGTGNKSLEKCKEVERGWQDE